MENGQINLQLDLSNNLYRVPNDIYEAHFLLFTEPQKGIFVWTESQKQVKVENDHLQVILGINRPVRNILWTYQVLFLELDLKHKEHKITVDHRFKLKYAVQPATGTPGPH